MKAPFNKLALGARFRYDNPNVDKTWVKISHTLIAEWDDALVAADWAGQMICSFADDDKPESLALEVILLMGTCPACSLQEAEKGSHG